MDFVVGPVPPAPVPALSPVPVISVVTPACNEEESIGYLVERVIAVLRGLGVEHELLIVDDGSSDGTWARIVEICRREPAVRGLRLSRNFGHQQALLAGLASARGSAIVSLDADLQHPPEVIPELYERWQAGHAVVRTVRKDAEVASATKRIASRRFYGVFSALTGIDMSAGNSDFRLIDASVRDELVRFRGRDIFLRGSVQWLGYPTASVDFECAPRLAGRSKYDLGRMLRFASSAIVSFSTMPLMVGIWVGLMTGCLAVLELIYVVVQYARGETVPGWASVVGVLSLFFAVLFLVLGTIGVYIARIHDVLQNRPPYVVAERTAPPLGA